jgi:hypothetical protein
MDFTPASQHLDSAVFVMSNTTINESMQNPISLSPEESFISPHVDLSSTAKRI